MTDGYGAGPGDAPPNGSDGYYAPNVGAEGLEGGPLGEDGQKRPRGPEEDLGPNKRPAAEEPVPVGPETVYRLLCDQSIVGGMIGRGGEKINAVQRNTGAFIQAIQDAPPHCLERVFVIAAQREPRPGEMYNDAQKALFELFESQLQLDRTQGGPVLRMLICATQAGSLIGKSGVTIKEMKEASGCLNIKVLQPNDLPPCGLASDKLLHITGGPDSLRKVLELCSTRLRDSPPKELPSHEPCQNAYPGPPPGAMGAPGFGPPGPGGPPMYGGPPRY